MANLAKKRLDYYLLLYVLLHNMLFWACYAGSMLISIYMAENKGNIYFALKIKYMRQTYKTSITDYYQNTDHTLRNEGTTANKGFLSCTVKK